MDSKIICFYCLYPRSGKALEGVCVFIDNIDGIYGQNFIACSGTICINFATKPIAIANQQAVFRQHLSFKNDSFQ